MVRTLYPTLYPLYPTAQMMTAMLGGTSCTGRGLHSNTCPASLLEMGKNSKFTELEPNTNLIFYQYSQSKLNRMLIIKDQTEHKPKILGVFPPL